VTPGEIRERFNAGDYAGRARTGIVQEVVVADRRLRDETSERRGEPIGTHRQMIAYYEGAQRVALAHRYLRPDGTIGATGRPDPKELLVDGTIWFV
jgi:hypothetical protein